MATNLISSKVLIAELFQDFNLNGTDWLGSVHRHIARALGIMRLSGYFTEAMRISTVKDYVAPLPCGMKELIAVVDIGGNVVTLPILNNNYIGKDFVSYLGASLRSGAINDGVLRTSFESGKVGFIYHRPPVDDKGYPMIPDNDDVMEALPFYIIMRLAYRGLTHPVITREEAEAKWRELYPIARNSVNFPRIEEVDHLVTSINDPYYERHFNYSVVATLSDEYITRQLENLGYLDSINPEQLEVIRNSEGLIQFIEVNY